MEKSEETNRGYAKHFVKGSTIVFAVSVASNIVGLVLRVFLARSLNATDYGLFYAVFALVAMFGSFRDLGIGQAVVRNIPKYYVKKRYNLIKSSLAVLMTVQVLFSLAAAAILITFSDSLAMTIFGASGASLVLKGLSGWFVFEAIYYTFRGGFQGLQDFPSLSLLSFLEIFLPFVFVVALVLIFGISAARVAFAYFGGLGITVLVAFGLFSRRHPKIYRAKTEINKPLCRELFRFALPVFLGGVTAAIIGQLGTILLASIRSVTEAGFYQIALPISNLLMYFPTAMGAVLFPMMSELWARGKEDLIRQAIHTIVKFSFILSIPAALIFVAFPDIVINLIFGSKYLAASAALQILAVTAVVQTIGVIINRVILGIGKPSAIAWITGITAAFTTVFNILLIPYYGVGGAALATFISATASLLLSIYFVRGSIRLSIPSTSIIKALAGGLLTLLFISELKAIIKLPPFIEFFAVMLPCLLFYSAWVLLTRTLTQDDLVLVRTTVPATGWLARMLKKLKLVKAR